MNGKLGGTLILLGLGGLGLGVRQAMTGDGAQALLIAFAGVVLALAGYNAINPGKAATAPPDSEAEPAPPAASEAAESPEGRFTIIQTGDDDALTRAARVLEADARITHIVEETGRWHTTPDRDDLPEWFALRVWCGAEDADALMEEFRGRLAAELGPDAAAKLSLQRF